METLYIWRKSLKEKYEFFSKKSTRCLNVGNIFSQQAEVWTLTFVETTGHVVTISPVTAEEFTKVSSPRDACNDQV